MKRCALLLVVLVSACARPGLISDRLYFGRTIPQATETVTDADWSAFVREVIAPAFSGAGWTVYRVEGGWHDPRSGMTLEDSFVLEHTHEPGAREDSLMHAIARAYITRFRQSAVLRVQTPARVQLIE